MTIHPPTGLRLNAVAKHSCLGVVVELQSLDEGGRGVQVDVVREIIEIGIDLHAEDFVVPMDADIDLIRLLGIEFGIASLVAENVVVHTIGTEFFRDGNAETLSDIGLHHPVARGVVDACRPRNAVEMAMKPCRALQIGRIGVGNRRLIPIVITLNLRLGVVVAHSGVQFQMFADGKTVESIGSEAQRLEIGNNKTPSTAPVVLIFGTRTDVQFVAFAELLAQTKNRRPRAFVESSFQSAVGRRHIAVADGFGMFFAQVALVSQIRLRRGLFSVPDGVTRDFQVVHPLIRQVDVAPRTVVVDIGQPHLQTVGIGEKSTLRITVGNAHIGVEMVAGIAEHHAAIALQTGGVAQSLVFQSDVIRIILYAVRRHVIVGIVDESGVGTVEKATVATADLRRKADLLVVRATKQLHGTAERLRRHVVGVKIEHAADGIAAVKQRRRTFDDLGAIDGKLVDFQSVVVAPLLSFVLDAVFADSHSVKTESANRGLRLPRPDTHSLHARNAFERLHQTAGEMLLKVVVANLY